MWNWRNGHQRSFAVRGLLQVGVRVRIRCSYFKKNYNAGSEMQRFSLTKLRESNWICANISVHHTKFYGENSLILAKFHWENPKMDFHTWSQTSDPATKSGSCRVPPLLRHLSVATAILCYGQFHMRDGIFEILKSSNDFKYTIVTFTCLVSY